MLYFCCQPRGMKYAYEALWFITCIKALYSEKTSHRILHGQFVTASGGEGKNCANDLKMEHCIQDNKQLMRGMRGNKTLKAVQRASSSSYGQKEFSIHFDKECHIPPDSTHHTQACTTEDVRAMTMILQQTKPFDFQAGRKLHSFPHISKSPLDKLDVTLLHSWLTNHKLKLFSGEFELIEVSADEEGAENSGDHDDGCSSEEDDRNWLLPLYFVIKITYTDSEISYIWHVRCVCSLKSKQTRFWLDFSMLSIAPKGILLQILIITNKY